MNGTDMQTPSRTELPLASSSSGCGCCSNETISAPPSETGKAYGVEGLTCASCVANVQRSISAVDGVESASVDLVPGGVSRLTITGAAERSAISGAIAAAGYSLTNS